jgi:hypothetical protein
MRVTQLRAGMLNFVAELRSINLIEGFLMDYFCTAQLATTTRK